MEFKGRGCTIYPLTHEGAVVPPGYDVAPFARAFQEKLARRLTKAGMQVGVPTVGMANDAFIVTGRIVRIDRGSRWSVFIFNGLLGYLLGSVLGSGASFEVEGFLGDGSAPFAALHAKGLYAMGMPWGKNERGIKTAATLAADSVSKQVVKALEAR
jgi:hypothetical protein